MSAASSKSAPPAAPSETTTAKAASIPSVPWRPFVGVLFVVFIYYSSQFFGGLLLTIYTALHHWNSVQANDWLSHSIFAQFCYIVLAEAFTLAAIYMFLRRYKLNFRVLGLVKPRWRDLGYGLGGAVVYYVIYLCSIPIISALIPALNVNQQQNIGFTDVQGAASLILTFISLAILPPLTEEIMVRGLLYSSLRKGFPKLMAVVVTSLIFASAHLPEGGAAGPLYIAALDTFILSVVLIYLRERTGSLWSSITVHGIKNGIAFLFLFVLQVH